jgi:hypothetical protein
VIFRDEVRDFIREKLPVEVKRIVEIGQDPDKKDIGGDDRCDFWKC